MADRDCSTSPTGDDALGLARADLIERVADAMRSVSRAYVTAIVHDLDRRGFTELTPASVSLLARLTPDGSQTVDLARQTRRTKQATGKLVAELENQGYVERAPHPDDGRAQLVRPTEKGRAALATGVGVRQALAERATTVLGPEALDRLYDDLALLEGVFTEKTDS